MQLKRLNAEARRSGPDGRLYIGGQQVVYDVTVVCPTAPSFQKKGVHAAFSERIKDKVARYKQRVEATPGQSFAVVGGTSFGHLCGDTVQLLQRLSAASDGEVPVSELRARLSSALVFASGQVLSSMETRRGVVHVPSPFQTILSKLGRKGDARSDSEC